MPTGIENRLGGRSAQEPVTSGFISYMKEFRLYPKGIREPFKGF